jgi:hypothetical protein
MGEGFKAAAALARAAVPGRIHVSAAAAALIAQEAPDVAVEHRDHRSDSDAGAAISAATTTAWLSAALGPALPSSRRAADTGPECCSAAACGDVPGSPAPTGPEPDIAAGAPWA